MLSQFISAKKTSGFEFYFTNKLFPQIKVAILLQNTSIFDLSNVICLLFPIINGVFFIKGIKDQLATLLFLIHINLSNMLMGGFCTCI